MNMLNDQEILQKIKMKIKEVVPENGQAFLFGSRARHQATENSDWDILVLLDKKKVMSEDYDNISYELRALGWNMLQSINTVIYTKQQWKDNSYSLFNKSVEEDAIVL